MSRRFTQVYELWLTVHLQHGVNSCNSLLTRLRPVLALLSKVGVVATVQQHSSSLCAISGTRYYFSCRNVLICVPKSKSLTKELVTAKQLFAEVLKSQNMMYRQGKHFCRSACIDMQSELICSGSAHSGGENCER